MPEINCILSNSDEYIHVKSDAVPSWVKHLDSLKDKIHAELQKPSEGLSGIKFCSPLDVALPNSKKP